MVKDMDTVRAICGSCGARYTVQISWLDSAVEYDCSCGARLRADMDYLFQIRHDMNAPSEITLQPLRV
jgi:lysyl-tRNA synthetase class I